MNNVPFVQISVAIVTFILAFTFRKALISRIMPNGKVSKISEGILMLVVLFVIPYTTSALLVSNFFPSSNVGRLYNALFFGLSMEIYLFILSKVEKVKTY